MILAAVTITAGALRSSGRLSAVKACALLKGFGTASEAVTGTTFSCIGDGGYEGLSAILVSESTEGFDEEFVGLIFSGWT